MTEAPQRIKELVEIFGNNKSTYKNSSYKEEHLRNEFLNVFFRELGWNMTNRGLPPERREVIHGASVRIDGSEREPDYCFAIEGEEKFYVEAKKPSVSIETDPGPAFQLRRYAWTGELRLSILTDFEEFAIYNAVTRPKKDDKARKDRVKIYNYTDYVDKWDEIASIFSKEAVSQGSLDEYIGFLKKKRGEQKVDDEFLQDLESWREDLAKNIAIRNPELSVRDLNYSVQKTLDRIVFLRMCEDRSIERYGQLLKIIEEVGIYGKLCKIFKKADEKYNSGLFHFKEEKNRPTIRDELTLNLNIDDKVLKNIIKNLYFPDSPYAFKVLPADILGNVYERFLGKVIRLTSSHRAKVEEKPEVRKAGGVYYTPKYIVDYIVENTVGKLCKGKTPNQISKLKILDPACGSGSFLLGAYTYLLKYHLDYYTGLKDRKRQKNQIYRNKEREWVLTIKEKKRILLNNIYGVDIDAQATEVTKLSLLLKVLEGEGRDIFEQQQKLFQERALPDLGNNIKCGNSLVDFDSFNKFQAELSGEEDDEKIYRINPFDWKTEFKEIFENGGFDAVIGNPPYVDVKILGEDIKKVLASIYSSTTRRFDLYVPFIERGLNLISQKGLLGYINPFMFTRRDYGIDLRKTIIELGTIESIVDFNTNQVFDKATNYVAIFILGKSQKQKNVPIIRFNRVGLDKRELERGLLEGKTGYSSNIIAPSKIFNAKHEWYFLSDDELKLVTRLLNSFTCFDKMVLHASEGIHSGKDGVFFIPKERVAELDLETPPTYPLAKGKEIHRYQYIDLKNLKNYVIYPYDLSTGNVIDESMLKDISPKTLDYLKGSRDSLKGRAYFDKSGKNWYELWCPRTPQLYTSEKIVGPEIASKGEFTLSKEQLFINNKLKALILEDEVKESLEYVLGLLNSSLLVYLHKTIAPPKDGGFFEVKTGVMGKLPIRSINFSDSDDKAKHDKMVTLVEQMLRHNKKLVTVNSPNEKQIIQRQMTAIDRQIDQLVYELYGLTEEEIKIVEGAL